MFFVQFTKAIAEKIFAKERNFFQIFVVLRVFYECFVDIKKNF